MSEQELLKYLDQYATLEVIAAVAIVLVLVLVAIIVMIVKIVEMRVQHRLMLSGGISYEDMFTSESESVPAVNQHVVDEFDNQQRATPEQLALGEYLKSQTKKPIAILYDSDGCTVRVTLHGRPIAVARHYPQRRLQARDISSLVDTAGSLKVRKIIIATSATFEASAQHLVKHNRITIVNL